MNRSVCPYVLGRNAARGAETVAAIQAEGGTARFVAADLGDLQSVAHLAEEAAAADVLVNNAGTFAFLATADQDVASFEAMFDVNVRGTFFLTAALAPKMAARGDGSIVNITTMAAEFGMAGAAAYGASKAAVVGLTRTWAAEFAANTSAWSPSRPPLAPAMSPARSSPPTADAPPSRAEPAGQRRVRWLGRRGCRIARGRHAGRVGG